MIKRIGIVGTGDIAHQFVTQIDKEKYEIVACYNHREESLKQFVTKHNIEKSYTEYKVFLAESNCDVVYIATPNQTHETYIREALLANKHVLCEKVMVMDGKVASELFQLASEKQLMLMEGVTLYFMPLFEQLRAFIDEGMLGKLSGINVTFGSCKELDVSNRFFNLDLGGGALFDIGPYALSVAVFFLGTDLELVASDVVMSESGVDEKSVSILKNKQNELASVMLSFRGKMPKQIILTGDSAYLIVNDFPRGTRATIHYNNGEQKSIEIGNDMDVFTYEIDKMNEYIENTQGEYDIREMSQHVMKLMDDMRREWGWEI